MMDRDDYEARIDRLLQVLNQERLMVSNCVAQLRYAHRLCEGIIEKCQQYPDDPLSQEVLKLVTAEPIKAH